MAIKFKAVKFITKKYPSQNPINWHIHLIHLERFKTYEIVYEVEYDESRSDG